METGKTFLDAQDAFTTSSFTEIQVLMLSTQLSAQVTHNDAHNRTTDSQSTVIFHHLPYHHLLRFWFWSSSMGGERRLEKETDKNE